MMFYERLKLLTCVSHYYPLTKHSFISKCNYTANGWLQSVNGKRKACTMDSKGNVIQTICSAYDNLSKTDQKIATFILDNRLTVPTMALREIADGCGTSSPTVSRFIKRLGFDDFNDLRLSLARNEGEQTSTTSVIGKSTESISPDRFQESLHYILTCKTAELADTVARLDEQTVMGLIERFNQADTILVAGVGNTRTLADNMAFKLRHLGLPGVSLTSVSDAIAFVPTLKSQDVLVVISSSGISRRLDRLVALSSDLAIPVAVITSNPQSPLIEKAQYVIMSTQRDRLFAYGVPFSHNSANFIIEVLFLFIHASNEKARRHIARYSGIQDQMDRGLNPATGEFLPFD